MTRVLIWGTGSFSEQFYEEIQYIFSDEDYELMGFVDNNPLKCGTRLFGKMIYSPSSISCIEYDEIVIATSNKYYSDIRKQLIDELGVSEMFIHSFTWFTITKKMIDEHSIECKKTGRIFDCFPFYNELDILELRLELLDPYVDFFVLSEIPQTHRWEDKPLYFKENRKRFAKFFEKILYVCTDDLPPKPKDPYLNWTLENYQRNCIVNALNGKAEAEDIVMVSDVDEIPDPEKLEIVRKNSWMLDRDVYSFSQEFYYYFFDFCHKSRWNGTFICKYKNLGIPQNWRNICGDLPEIPNGGWHLSYFGGAERIRRKISSTVDSAEFQVSSQEIVKRISEGRDIFGREGTEFDIERIDVSRIGIRDMKGIRERYPQFFLGEVKKDE